MDGWKDNQNSIFHLIFILFTYNLQELRRQTSQTLELLK